MASKHLDSKLFDRRTLDINLNRGAIKKSDYDKFLSSLPDETENSETVLVDEEELTHTISWVNEDEEEAGE